MKNTILKISGHKNEKSFYKEFPTQEAFMAKHGSALKKAQYGDDVDFGGLSFVQPGDTEFMNEGMAAVGDTPGATDAASLSGGGSGTGTYVQAGIQAIGAGIQAKQNFKNERAKVKSAQAWADTSDIVKQSFNTEDIDAANVLARNAKRKRDAFMPIVTGNELFPSYGTGTNILASKSGGKIKKAQGGQSSDYWQRNGPSWTSFANTASAVTDTMGNGPDAGSELGGNIGQAAGTAVGMYFGGPIGAAALGAVGKWAGGTLGGALDKNDDKIKAANAHMNANMAEISNIQNIRGKYSAYAEHGGNYKSPQVLKYFGNHAVGDLFKPDPMMDTLRTGGNIRQNSVGDITALSGGHLEPVSYNPYSDGNGITSMIKGQTHDESNGRHSGVLLNYSQAKNGSMEPSVEAENNEPVTEIGDSAVVFGDQVINRLTVGDDPMFEGLKGKTFKKAMAGIAEQNSKLFEKKKKVDDKVASYDPVIPMDKLEGNSLMAMHKGIDMRYAMNDTIMRKAAAHQEIVNNEAARLGINSGDFSRGKLSPADNESSFAQHGKTKRKKVVSPESFLKPAQLPSQQVTAPNLSWVNNYNPESTESIESAPTVDEDTTFGVTPYQKFGWETLAGQIMPWIRKQPGEGLQGDQLAGEMFALSNNQEEPVDARFYHPDLQTPYNISYQDQLNANQADFNQLVQASGDNPQALAALAAQKYGANSRVLAEQFRANQANRNQVTSGNLQTLNDAQLKNMQIADQQYVRQAQAKSATKAVKQSAISSIAGKIGQNRLENRTLQTYANMFPDYSFDSQYRIRKTGAPVDWQIDQGIYNKKGKVNQVPIYDENQEITGYKSVTAKDARNGGIVKAFKNL
jgi:hypothetical protein